MQHAEVLKICYAFLFDIKGLPKTTAEQSARGYAHSLWRVWDERCSNERPSEPEGETPRAWFHGPALRTAAGCLKNVKQLSIISFCWYGSTWRAMASWCAMVNLDPAEIRSERLHCRCDCLGGCFVARRPRRSHPRATPTSHRSPFCTWSHAHARKPFLSSGKCLYFCLGPWPWYSRFR